MKRVPGALRMTCAADSIRLLAATGEGEQALRRFSMTAYTGAAMQVAGWDAPVVVDLAGLRRLRGAKPILLDHDTRQRVGHAEQIRVEGGALLVEGLVSGASAAANEVVASSINGFPWQASVGALVEKAIFVPAGKTAQANGSEVHGPVYIARKANLAVPRVSQNFCRAANNTDFKVHTRYRMTMAGNMEQVGPDGELKHLTLGEQGYTNQLATYGGIVALNRQQLHNDDLNALVDTSRFLGRKSAIAVEKAVFALLLSNSASFFSVGNKNLVTGAASALSVSGITAAEQKFMDQVDEQGEPVALEPALMLVPTGLKIVAEQLFSERVVNETTTTDKPKPASNPHAGRFRPAASPYLNAQALAGSSTTAWCLFADPADVAAMEIAYLNGVTTPTIESGETDFNTLGIQWRCYFDFGVAMQDFRAAVRSDGV